MTEAREKDAASTQPLKEPGHCLLLLRSPSDREIYNAFRTIAAHAEHGCREQLKVEGELSLTAGLCAPQIPSTVQRLLDADAEMIDQLEVEFGGVRWTYLRSGGHPPFRESFFDEMHVQQTDTLSFSETRLFDLLESALSSLSIATHNGDGSLYDLVSEVVQHMRRSESPASPVQSERRL